MESVSKLNVNDIIKTMECNNMGLAVQYSLGGCPYDVCNHKGIEGKCDVLSSFRNQGIKVEISLPVEKVKRCLWYHLSRAHRKNELLRGGKKSDTSSYEDKCFKCDGYNTKCFHNPLYKGE